jgi:prepilin signal peptidase PulO-like enzyme (type II secretory pathway)
MVIFVYDLKHYIIPDKVLFPALGVALLYRFLEIWPLGFENFNSFINPLLSGLVPLFFFLAIYFVSRGKWLGFGDVKLVFLLGFFLGFPNILVSLFLSFFFGAIIGIGLILAKRKNLKSEVPFGPFLIAGAFLALFWGEKLANWYLNLFLF